MVKRLMVVAAVLVVLAAASAARAGYECYVSIEGTKQGKFKGEATHDARFREKIGCVAFSFEVISPRDAASGQASGKRVYKPLTITKELGAASPQLLQACVTNEVLKTVVLEFVKTNANGEETVFYTIKLTNASIAGIHQWSGAAGEAGNTKHPTAADGRSLEEISFTFQHVEVESKDGKTIATDDVSK